MIRLPDQSILHLFIAGLCHFSAPPAPPPPLAICRLSESVFDYSAALCSVHRLTFTSDVVESFPSTRVVHPFHSLSVTLHLPISPQTLEGSSCWNIYWSVFLFSLSALFIFLCLFCPPPKQSNKVQSWELSEAEEGLKSSLPITYLACSTLWFHSRGRNLDGDATARESLTAVSQRRAFPCKTITFLTRLLCP